MNLIQIDKCIIFTLDPKTLRRNVQLKTLELNIKVPQRMLELNILRGHGKKPNIRGNVVWQPSEEVSQKKVVVVVEVVNLLDKDFIDYKWVMQHVDSYKKVILITARGKGDGQQAKERPFSTVAYYDWIMKTLPRRTS